MEASLCRSGLWVQRWVRRYPRSLFTTVIAALAAISIPSASVLADDAEGDPLDWVSVTPRFWLSAVDPGDAGILVRESTIVPMGGLSATIAPPVLPGLSFGLTLLGGGAESDVVFDPDGAGFRDGDGDIIRVDLEFLARYQLPETPLSIYFGPRYIHFTEKYDGDDFSVDAIENNLALQVGLGAASDLTASGNHRLFANIMTGVVFVFSEVEVEADGLEADSDDTDEFPLLDLNSGYQYILGDHVSLSARYRFYIVFNENSFDFDSTFLVHGPEVGATFRF